MTRKELQEKLDKVCDETFQVKINQEGELDETLDTEIINVSVYSKDYRGIGTTVFRDLTVSHITNEIIGVNF